MHTEMHVSSAFCNRDESPRFSTVRWGQICARRSVGLRGSMKVTHARIRILVGDDNRDFCDLLAQYVATQPDFELVGVAHNGNEVLEALRETRPDVLVLDMVMPHLDGLGVLEALGQAELNPRPKVIMLTGFGQDAIMQKLVEMGADYYVLKPFALDVLANRIRQLVGAPTAAAAAAAPPAHGRNLEQEVRALLQEVGVPAHIKGYRYLRDAILLVTYRDDLLEGVTKELYPMIARQHETTPSRVERAIRHAIEVAWSRGSVATLARLFGQTVSLGGKPSNSEFIAMAADRLRAQLRTA
jgi:two-component system response regulator (stage 0 sporulation protein A)